MATNNVPSQMQTPPPTRDPTKRKPQQPQIRFATPSTIKSRRQSMPGESWLKSTLDHVPLDSTPFQPGTLQFSPVDSLPFSSPGPATAPTHPQMNLFWDGNSHSDYGLDQFELGTGASSNPVLNPFDFSPMPQKFRNDLPFSSPIKPSKNRLDESQSLSSQSVTSSRAARHSVSGSSFVDPSMIWSENKRDPQSINISEPAARNPKMQPGQPYQFHVDELRREKEQTRGRREAPTRPRTSLLGSSSTGRPGLQRSFTDSKSRRSFNAATMSGDLGEITRGLAGTHIPRRSSPIKRQRLSGSFQASASTQSPARKSVVLEIDETGRAKTVVKAVTEPLQKHPETLLEDESDSDDMRESLEPSNRSSSTVSQAQEPIKNSGLHHAQDALRDMIEGRRQRNKPAADSCSLDRTTNVATDGLVGTAPFTTSAQNFNQITNCVCGNNVPNALMIQW